MNAITDAVSAGTETLSTSEPPQSFTLRRTGRKPLRFDGWLIIEAASQAEPGSVRHELRLYRATCGQIIIELVTRRHSTRAPDLERVVSVASMDEAATWLQAYDCAADLPVPSALTDAQAPLATAALHAVSLRTSAAFLQDEYNSLISDVFAALDMADTLAEA